MTYASVNDTARKLSNICSSTKKLFQFQLITSSDNSLNRSCFLLVKSIRSGLGDVCSRMAMRKKNCLEVKYSAVEYMFIVKQEISARAFIRGTQRQFSENICSEDDLRSRIFGTSVVKFLACLPILGFSKILNMV